MNDELDWTTDLGNAVLAQQADVMDAIQRLRAKAQDNGKLATTKQQTVSVANRLCALLRAASGLRDVAVSRLSTLLLPAGAGLGLGGAIASGIAWGAAIAIGNEIWDDHDYFNWGHGDINVDIDRNVNIDRNNINVGKWEHNSYHRRGVKYDNNAIRNQFAKAGTLPSDRKLDYKGTGRRSGAEARRGRSQARRWTPRSRRQARSRQAGKA
jgi:Protein of unknown function (DUF3300)